MVIFIMPDNQGSSSPLISFGRSLFSSNRSHASSSESRDEPSSQDSEFHSFHELISTRFHDICNASSDEFLSLDWIMKLLDAFSSCQDEFRLILSNNKLQIKKPPLDRLVKDFFEKSIKALDICNANRNGIERIRLWEKQLEIVLCALDFKKKPNGQFGRARKALGDLSLAMTDERDSGSNLSHRNRSFGRHGTSKDHHKSSRHSRSLSWSVSRSWSAAKQLLSMSSNLSSPRGNEVAATDGLALPIHSMSFVLMFVLWTLVAAIPCQDRGLNIHLSFPKQLSWVPPFVVIHERIMDESKKREKRNSSGLLKEIYQIDKCSTRILDLLDSVSCPLSEEHVTEIGQVVEDVAAICGVLKNGLDPLERRLREVFKKIMLCRTEGLEFLGGANSSD